MIHMNPPGMMNSSLELMETRLQGKTTNSGKSSQTRRQQIADILCYFHSLSLSLVPKEDPKLLVIPKQENADWRSKSLEKRKKQYVPEESLRTPMEIIEEPVKEVGYGLQITKRTKIEHVSQEESAPEPVVEQVTIEETAVIEKEETIEELAARKIMEGMCTIVRSTI
jgi:hypothetical protein